MQYVCVHLFIKDALWYPVPIADKILLSAMTHVENGGRILIKEGEYMGSASSFGGIWKASGNSRCVN